MLKNAWLMSQCPFHPGLNEGWAGCQHLQLADLLTGTVALCCSVYNRVCSLCGVGQNSPRKSCRGCVCCSLGVVRAKVPLPGRFHQQLLTMVPSSLAFAVLSCLSKALSSTLRGVQRMLQTTAGACERPLAARQPSNPQPEWPDQPTHSSASAAAAVISNPHTTC